MSKTLPPQANELELSLFGPGIGECVVVHLGHGDWMVVDSCRSFDGKRPVALEYLEGIGIDIKHQVKLIVATHWHDDHIRGLAQLVDHAEAARFVCSSALHCKEFLTLVLADRDVKLVAQTSGISEFADILHILSNRSTDKCAAGPNQWATEGSRLYVDSDRNVEVWALSPSSQTVTDSKAAIAGLLPSPRAPIRRFYQLRPNDLSVTIMVIASRTSLLLGADLERGRDQTRGWQAVVNSKINPTCLSQIYKVAHHGSADADLGEIWTKLVARQPHAVLTPYARGAKPLPSPEDVSRMKRRASSLFCTAWPPAKSPPRRDPAVERTMKEMGVTLRAVRKQPGHIRVRIPIAEDIPPDTSVELFGGARAL